MRPFRQVDVFALEPLRGNPVAVVHDAEGLSTTQMECFTRWTNLSEATFLLPPTESDADYQVRIFTGAGELSFAGHPTLGSCHAWLQAGGRPRDRNRIVQQCPAGLVALRSIDGLLAFKAPRLRRSGPLAAADLERVATILGIAATEIVASAWADNGPGWMAVLLASADAVLALQPSDDGAGHLDIGVVGFYPGGSDPAYEVRAFYSNGQGGLVEDPVTGSLNASLAQWLIASGRISTPYTASQGTLLGRTGRPQISQDNEGSVWVGGATHTIVEGLVDIE